jgi:hypothetical protein
VGRLDLGLPLGAIQGHEVEHPMAIVILGGLVTATLLNLFVLPSLYLRFGNGRAAAAKSVALVVPVGLAAGSSVTANSVRMIASCGTMEGGRRSVGHGHSRALADEPLRLYATPSA